MLDKTKPVYSILILVCIAHFFNDAIQAIIPASYPMLSTKFNLSFAQIGVITLCYQLAGSIFQPIVGAYTDKNPMPYSQVIGMLFSTIGIVILSYATNYIWVLISVVLIGIGSSIFHPESSRVAYLASEGKRSLAQSIFQIGGNAGTSLAPLLVAWIVIPNGQKHLLYFLFFAFLAQITLIIIGKWYHLKLKNNNNKVQKRIKIPLLSKNKVKWYIFILLLLIFSKFFYTASITSYFQFYTIYKFGITEVQAQIYLFYFLISTAIGVLLGGFIGDKIGRKSVIWFSVLGVAPFSLALPYANLPQTAVLINIIGFIISSAFPSILVYAQELLPKKIGLVSGLFYGFAFGMGGLGAAVLGKIADITSIATVYSLCSFLPLMGVIAYFLPNMKNVKFIEEKNNL